MKEVCKKPTTPKKQLQTNRHHLLLHISYLNQGSPNLKQDFKQDWKQILKWTEIPIVGNYAKFKIF